MFSQHGFHPMKDLLTAIEQCSLLEKLASDHMFEGIKLYLFPYTVKVFDDIVNLFPQVGGNQESVFLLVDGLIHPVH